MEVKLLPFIEAFSGSVTSCFTSSICK